MKWQPGGVSTVRRRLYALLNERSLSSYGHLPSLLCSSLTLNSHLDRPRPIRSESDDMFSVKGRRASFCQVGRNKVKPMMGSFIIDLTENSPHTHQYRLRALLHAASKIATTIHGRRGTLRVHLHCSSLGCYRCASPNRYSTRLQHIEDQRQVVSVCSKSSSDWPQVVQFRYIWDINTPQSNPAVRCLWTRCFMDRIGYLDRESNMEALHHMLFIGYPRILAGSGRWQRPWRYEYHEQKRN